MMNKPVFSPEHTWTRISRAIATYGGEVDEDFYKKLLARTECPPAIAELQRAGVGYMSPYTWAYELCGSFEVTHPSFKPPPGSELPAALVLYNALIELFGPPNF